MEFTLREATIEDTDAVRHVVFAILTEYGLEPTLRVPTTTNIEGSYRNGGGTFRVVEELGIVGCGGRTRHRAYDSRWLRFRLVSVSDEDFRPFEIVGDPHTAGPFMFTCEHASNAIPPWLRATEDDQVLLDDHWGWDIGAADVTRILVTELGGHAVLSRFSRLVADPNREPSAASYIPRDIDGQTVSFNRDLGPEEINRRTRTLFDAYHGAIDESLELRQSLAPPVHVIALHSFTPLYLGRARPIEVGVLFDDYDEDAWHLQEALQKQGFESALNAPYSGKPPEGLIYAARRHGRRHKVKYLELEIRQDLIAESDKAARTALRVANALRSFRPA